MARFSRGTKGDLLRIPNAVQGLGTCLHEIFRSNLRSPPERELPVPLQQNVDVINGDERLSVVRPTVSRWPPRPNTSLLDGSASARHTNRCSDRGFHPIEGLGRSHIAARAKLWLYTTDDPVRMVALHKWRKSSEETDSPLLDEFVRTDPRPKELLGNKERSHVPRANGSSKDEYSESEIALPEGG
jgi:hypothetical protein